MIDMMKIDIYRAKRDFKLWDKSSFLEGDYILGKRTNGGGKYQIRKNSGEWTVIDEFRMSMYDFPYELNLEEVSYFLIENKKEVRNIPSHNMLNSIVEGLERGASN